MSTLILLRHGQSDWNERNLFTGWVDIDLSETGEREARMAGELLIEEGLLPTVCHTSVLVRAIRTANLTLEVCDRLWLPVRRSWRLNERHYGALQGLNKAEMTQQYGADQVHLWRRSYDVRPPAIEPGSRWGQSDDPRYAWLARDIVPSSECLADVVVRMMPYWYDGIIPDLRAGETVLVSAHGNSLRALVKHLEQISDADIPGLNIPTGIPRRYELDDDLNVVSASYLGDPEAATAAAAAVAAQAAGTPSPEAPAAGT